MVEQVDGKEVHVAPGNRLQGLGVWADFQDYLGVAYNAHVMEAILTTVAPALGWR